MTNLKKWTIIIVAGALAIAAAYAGGRFSAPTKVVEKVVTKTVEVEKKVEVVKWKTRTVTKYVNQSTIKQDKDTDCTEKFSESTGKLIERHCVVHTNTNSSNTSTGGTSTTNAGSSNTTTDHTATNETTSTKVTINERPNWRVGAMALVDPKDLTLNLNSLNYGFSIERRIIWEIYVGATVVPQAHLYGLSLSFNF